jgi:hypothetical protein
VVKFEDLNSREVSLDYREKRMADEKAFLQEQSKGLMEELRKKNNEIIQLRREQTAK